MAAGDITLFEEFRADIGNGIHNLHADTIKLAILTAAVVPTAADASPRLGNYTQVTDAGTYVDGGTDLAATYTQASGTATFDGTINPSWAQDASNGNNARYGLIYNDTATNDEAIGFVDLGATIDMSAGTLTATVNASGIFELT